MSNFTFKHDDCFNDHNAIIMVDNETGVNYIVKANEKSASIVPRLKASGEVYVSYPNQEVKK